MDGALPFEQVDPFSGNLVVTATDLVLPENAGLDVRVTRVYNSSIYPGYNDNDLTFQEDSWTGLGLAMLGARMIMEAQGPSRWAHYDEARSFRPQLTGNGQNYGVYAHVTGGAGAALFGIGVAQPSLGRDIVMAQSLRDRVEGMLGSKTAQEEIRGNVAGYVVGAIMADAAETKDQDKASAAIRKVLCQ